jgi:hypothetical protein
LKKDEDEQVNRDEHVIDDGRACAVRVIIAYRDDHFAVTSQL